MDPQQLPLRDIHLPDPIGWWPLAPGWWIAAGLMGLVTLVIFLLLARRRRHRVKRASAKAFALLRQTTLPAKEKISALSALLRRIAITAYPQDNVASLTGNAWLQFLDKSLDGPSFSEGKGLLLIDTPYQPERLEVSANDLDALFDLCQHWIKALPATKPPQGRKTTL